MEVPSCSSTSRTLSTLSSLGKYLFHKKQSKQPQEHRRINERTQRRFDLLGRMGIIVRVPIRHKEFILFIMQLFHVLTNTLTPLSGQLKRCRWWRRGRLERTQKLCDSRNLCRFLPRDGWVELERRASQKHLSHIYQRSDIKSS